jgi:hypothetical protein
VTIDAIDRNGDFENDLDIRGSAVSPSMKSLPLRIAQVAPGRYEATFDAPEVGPYIINLGYRDPTGGQRTQTTGAVVPYSPEYRDLQANTALLSTLADRTGGRVYPAIRTTELNEEVARALPQAFRHDRRAQAAPTDFWPALLLLAALLFPLDVAARRLMLEPGQAGLYAASLARRAGETLGLRASRRPVRGESEALGRLLARRDRTVGRMSRGEGAESPTEPQEGPPVRASAGPPTAPAAAPPSVAERSAPSRARVTWHRTDAAPPERPAADASEQPVPPEGGPSGPASAPEQRPGAHTEGLLAAKRRARRQQEQKRDE